MRVRSYRRLRARSFSIGRFAIACALCVSLGGPILAGESVVSDTHLAGKQLRLVYSPPAPLVVAPDFRAAARVAIPGAPIFDTALALVGGGRVLAPGKYALSVRVEDDASLWLVLVDSATQLAFDWPLEIGEFDGPGRGFTARIMGETTASGARGSIQLRWRALVLDAAFVVAATETTTIPGYRLDAHRLTGTEAAEAQVRDLGSLERQGTGARRYTVTWHPGGSTARLTLTSTKIRRLLTERSTLVSITAKTLSATERSLNEARLRRIDEHLLEERRSGGIVEIVGEELGSVESAGQSARLEFESHRPRLVVTAFHRAIAFPLPPAVSPSEVPRPDR